jgi:hypothetical protein
MKALIDTESDRILGFTIFGASAGEVMTTVQLTMLAGLPYTALRDAIIAHPTMPEGLIFLMLAVPAKASLSALRSQARQDKTNTYASNEDCHEWREVKEGLGSFFVPKVA